MRPRHHADMNRRIKLVAESVKCYGARVLTLDAAEGLLTPYKKSIFIEPIREAVDCWHEFVEESPSKALAMDATARANMIHCWWVQNVRSQLEVEIGIREIEALQFFAVVIEKAPIVRFKLLSSGRSGNVATDQQKLLGMQQYKEEVADAMALEGIPNPPTILTSATHSTTLSQFARLRFATNTVAGLSGAGSYGMTARAAPVRSSSFLFPTSRPRGPPWCVRPGTERLLRTQATRHRALRERIV